MIFDRPVFRPAARRSLLLLPLILLLGLFALGCSSERSIVIDDRVIKVACGSCVFEMPEAKGCPWAAEIDGEHYLIQGAVPKDHNSHLADGICNMPREARVKGELRGDTLYVSSMVLLPAEQVPEAPRFTPEDLHE